jgi:hypothetical protein
MVRQGNRLRWTVVVPPNAIATLSFPSGKIDEITESGKAVLEAIGIAVGKDSGGRPTVRVGSGDYRFELPL